MSGCQSQRRMLLIVSRLRLDRSHVEGGAGLVGAHLDRSQAEGLPCERDVAPEIGLLERQLVRQHDEALHRDRQHDQDQEHGGDEADGQHGQAPCLAGSDHGIGENHDGDREQGGGPERPARDVDGGVPGAEHGAGGFGQQLVAVQDVPRRPGEEEQRSIGEKVVEHRARCDDPETRPVGDEPGPSIDDRQRGRARERQDGNGVLDPLEERELEQVEGDVVAVERLRLTERLRPKEADEVVPSFREAEPDDDRRHERGEHLDRPDQPKSERSDVGPGRRAVALGVKVRAVPTRSTWRASTRRLPHA